MPAVTVERLIVAMEQRLYGGNVHSGGRSRTVMEPLNPTDFGNVLLPGTALAVGLISRLPAASQASVSLHSGRRADGVGLWCTSDPWTTGAASPWTSGD